jgi:hypothetical protein
VPTIAVAEVRAGVILADAELLEKFHDFLACREVCGKFCR